MVKIKEWLDGDRDYDAGLLLLMKHSRNRTLIRNLGRQQRPGKLIGELRRISGVTTPIAPIAPKVEEEAKEEGKTDAVARNRVQRVERELKYDDMPKELQEKWNQAKDAYKEQRSLHEKLKLMLKAPVADREPLTVRIAQLDGIIRSNWETIDAYVPGEEEKKKPAAPLVPLDHKRINANRKYISVWLRKLETEEFTEKRKENVIRELKLRYGELTGAGEAFAEETIEALTLLNVIDDGQTGDA